MYLAIGYTPLLAACVGDAALVSDKVNGSEVAEQPREGSMTFRRIAVAALAGLVWVFPFTAVSTRAQDQPRPDQLVDALNGVFGKHAGDRAAHTKGICLTGQFTPAPDAPSLSKAPQFAKPVGITARFSLGGGNPQAPDNAQDNVRGLSISATEPIVIS
jgi:hypothetical protein